MEMYFAGAENRAIMNDLITIKAPRLLTSYFYVKQRGVKIQEMIDNFEKVVLDSGAFTYMAKIKIKKAPSLEDYQKYLDEYLEFIYDNIGKFIWVANFDIDKLVGHKRVEEWNKEFEKIEAMGQRVCYVAHDRNMQLKNTMEYIEKYKYIGASGVSREKSNAYFSRLYNASFKNKVYTHGFGLTAFNTFQRFPMTTCDSTTYLGGAKFGSTYVWNGSFFETWDYTKKHRRKNLKKWCDLWNINFEGFIGDDVRQVNRFNACAWLENEKFFNKITKTRQWWTKEKLEMAKENSAEVNGKKTKILVVNEKKTKVGKAKTAQKYSSKEKKKLRNEVTHKLRFDVLERDQYTCQYCGLTNEDEYEDGEKVKLVIDHKIPLDKGGTNDLDNLLTACFRCNEGKKDRVLKVDSDEKLHEILNRVELDSVREVISNGATGDNIKEYFKSSKSLVNREVLFEFNDLQKNDRCIKDCEECFADSNLFTDCFKILSSEVRFADDEEGGETTTALAIRKKESFLAVSGDRDDVMACDSCYAIGRCPKYVAGSLCAFNFTSAMNFRNLDDLWDYTIQLQSERVQRQALFEKIDGGSTDKNLTSEIQVLAQLLRQKDGRNRAHFNFGMSGSAPINPINPMNSEQTQQGGNQVGAIGQLVQNFFNSGNKPKEEEKDSKVKDAEETNYTPIDGQEDSK